MTHAISRRLRVALGGLLLPLLMANRGCDEDLDKGDRTEMAACTLEECGPAPGAPNYMCNDGSVGGPGPCERNADGKCGYTFRECEAVGDGGGGVAACGTRAGVSCAEGEFCNFAPDKACGATDRGGVCAKKPEACAGIYAPVCGCDGETYSSDCEANAAGVSVRAKGECGAGGDSGETCGGIAGLTCGEGLFCNYEKEAGGQGCDGSVADAGGTCEQIPAGCSKEYAPVCGCDHRTYANRCTAHAHGAAVMHEGACTVSDCKAVGGRPVDGIGPGPKCEEGEAELTRIVYDNGDMAIEGTACCVPAEGKWFAPRRDQ